MRIDTQQADCLLACDLVAGASNDALQSVKHGRTEIIVNTHEMPTAAFLRDPDADMHAPALLEKMHHAAGKGRVVTVDAHHLCARLLGDTMAANILMLGFCWQRGLVPVTAAALARAIELNGIAIEQNRTAFALGRLAAANPAALVRLAGVHAPAKAADSSLDALLVRCRERLAAYQNAAWAERHARFVEEVRAVERRIVGDGELALTAIVARQLARLMSYKDEYEVARLFASPEFVARLADQFSGWKRLSFHMAPAFLAPARAGGRAPKKIALGGWMLLLMRLLSHGKFLRGTALDPFGQAYERRLERQLIGEYEALVRSLLPELTAVNLALARRISEVPAKIRGYGHIKIAGVATARAQWASLGQKWRSGGHVEPAEIPVDAEAR